MPRPFKKILNSNSAYTVLVDNQRLIEKQIDKDIRGNPHLFKLDKVGLYLTENHESLPVFSPLAPVEKIIHRAGTSAAPSGGRILFTKDNYGNRRTGLGGAGGTMCEAIDIVAGSLSCEKKLVNSGTQSRANFISDGARIYLTERGDIQHYFGLGNGSSAVSVSSNLKSGIGIKADHTLLIGRERVRILAGLCAAVGGERLVNGNKNVTPRIELARVGDDSSQPAVLGDNLVAYLKKQSAEIQTLRNRLLELETKLHEYKTAMAFHTHVGFGVGAVICIPSGMAAVQGVKSIPQFLRTTEQAIIDTYKQQMGDLKAMGTENEVLLGTKEDRLLSSTVYIGM